MTDVIDAIHLLTLIIGLVGVAVLIGLLLIAFPPRDTRE